MATAPNNHNYHLYQNERLTKFLLPAISAKESWKMLRAVMHKPSKLKLKTKKKLGLHGFCKITNKYLNRGKGKLPALSIINGHVVIMSASDKVKIFAIEFACNSTLDNKGHSSTAFTFSQNINFMTSLLSKLTEL